MGYDYTCIQTFRFDQEYSTNSGDRTRTVFTDFCMPYKTACAGERRLSMSRS